LTLGNWVIVSWITVKEDYLGRQHTGSKTGDGALNSANRALASALGSACSAANNTSATVQRAGDAFSDGLNGLELALKMSGTSNSALSSTDSTLASALSGACSAADNTGASIQGASNAFSDGLNHLQLTFDGMSKCIRKSLLYSTNARELTLDVCRTSNSALNSTNGTLTSALGGSNSATSDTGDTVQRARNALGNRLNRLQLALEMRGKVVVKIMFDSVDPKNLTLETTQRVYCNMLDIVNVCIRHLLMNRVKDLSLTL
jgi:hypothetical protein